MKKILSLCLFLLTVYLINTISTSCNPAGDTKTTFNLLIGTPFGVNSGFMCDGRFNPGGEQVDYEIAILTYDANQQPKRWGSITRVTEPKGGLNNGIELQVPQSGEFAIEIRGKSRYCKKIPACNFECGRETYYYLTNRITFNGTKSATIYPNPDDPICSC